MQNNNDLICNKAVGRCSKLVLLDLSAAFDTVDHHTLVWDLEILVYQDLHYLGSKTYLTNKIFKGIVNDEESEQGNMKYGVPQGKIRGPVLFIIYTLTLHYMTNYYNPSYYFYAGDTLLYFKLYSIDQCLSKLNTALIAAWTWMFKRKMKLDKEKTNIMVVGNHLQLRNIGLHSNFKLDQTDINLSTKLRSLGVVLMKVQLSSIKLPQKKEGYWRSYKYCKNIEVYRQRV